MLTDLYLPIPDIDLYLKKLHMERPVELTRDYLDQLIYHHQMYVTYGNLDPYLFHKDLSLSIPDLFEKVIVNGREGFCFELNGLFYMLLKDLGYDVYPCFCKVIEGPEPVYPALHRGTIVRMDGKKLFCDVGFGGPAPGGSLELTEGLHTIAGDTYSLALRPEDDWWALDRKTSNGDFVHMIRISTYPQDLADFLAPCHFAFCRHNPVFTHFTEAMYLNMRTPDGHASITGNRFRLEEKGQAEDCVITSVEQLNEILHNIFHLPENLADHL